MKKLFALMLIGGFFAFAACKKSEKTEETTTTETETTTTTEETGKGEEATTSTETTTEASSSSAAMPEFSSAGAKEYAKMYQEYVDAYLKAVESKDAAQLQELSKKGQEMATKMSTIKDITAEDSKKLGEWMTAKSKELQEAATKAAK